MKTWNPFRKAVAAALAAIVAILSPGLGAYEACATVVTRINAGEAAVGTVQSGVGSTAVSGQSTLTNNALSLSLTPAALSNLPVSGPAVAERQQTLSPAAAADVKTITSIPVLSKAASIQTVSPAVTVTGKAIHAAPAEQAKGQPAAQSPLASLETSQEQVSAILSKKVSNEGAVSAAAMPFEGLSQTISADVPAVEVQPAGQGKAKPASSGLRRAAIRTGSIAFTGAAAYGLHHVLSNVSLQAPIWTKALDLLGAAGYYLGNGLAFVFAIPQIIRTFEDGHHGATPVRRALLGVAASLALGLISAPLAVQLFWGVQNIFGALTLGAPIILGKILRHYDAHLTGRAAWLATAAVCGALLAASFGLYAAASALLPGLLTALLGKAGISVLTLGIQVVTGAAFLFLFAPDIEAILKKQAPKGFTSFFSLMFAIASFGFIAWTMQKAVASPAGSSERVQFIIYAVQNAIYAAVAMMSYLYSRKHELMLKKK